MPPISILSLKEVQAVSGRCCCVWRERETYSASHEDWAMSLWKIDTHVTAPPARKVTPPDTDRLKSGSSAKSASAKLTNLLFPEGEYFMSLSAVPFKYLYVLIVAFRWTDVGEDKEQETT